MSRHRSPRGRLGDTTPVVEPRPSVPRPRAVGLSPDTQADSAPELPLLPSPRVSQSGPMPVIDPALTFGGAPDFAAALGLRPSAKPEPELAGGTALDGPSALDGEPADHAPALPEHDPLGSGIPLPRSATDWLSVAHPAPVEAPYQADGAPEDDQSEDVRPEDDLPDGELAPGAEAVGDVPPGAG